MKSFAQKKAELAKLKNRLGRAKLTVFTTFARTGEKGLDVKQMAELKRGLRASQAEYLVGKKTLIQKAQSGGLEVFNVNGSVGLSFAYGDEQAAAKALYDFARKHAALQLLGARWNGQSLDAAAFTAFAKLPGRLVLLRQLAGVLQYPLSALANRLGQVAEEKTT